MIHQDETLKDLRSAYENEPDVLDNILQLGQYYCDLGWYNEASELYAKALVNNENEYSLLIEYGNLCYKKRDFNTALNIFKKTTEIQPGKIEAWNNYGITLLSVHDYENAYTAFHKVLDLEPENSGALLNMGNYHFAQNDYLKAITFFEKAVKSKPDFSDGWFNLGNSYFFVGEYKKAIEMYERALRIHREFPSALKNIGVAYEKLHEYELAIDFYTNAVTYQKTDSSLYVNMANVYYKMGNYSEANKNYLKAVRLAPKDTQGWLGLRRLSLHKGDITTYVRATLSILSRLSPQEISQTIENLIHVEQFSKAKEVIEHIDRINLKDIQINAQKLLLQIVTKEINENSEALYEELCQSGNKTDSILNICALYAIRCLNNYSKAENFISQIKDPTDEMIILNAQIKMALGDFITAHEIIGKLLGEDCTNYNFYFTQAKIDAHLGNELHAREYLLKAFELGFTNVEEINAEPNLKRIFDSLTSQKTDFGFQDNDLIDTDPTE